MYLSKKSEYSCKKPLRYNLNCSFPTIIGESSGAIIKFYLLKLMSPTGICYFILEY